MEAWAKMNVDKLFSEFTSRPIRSSVNDMAENYMAMDMEKRMTSRDKARRDFIRNFKKKQAIKRSTKNTIIAEREKFLDFREQIQYQTDKPLKAMKYEELVETLNKDLSALEQLSGNKNTTVKVFEEEKEMEIQLEKEREKIIVQTKKIVYPFYLVTGFFLTLIWYGQYQ